MMKDELLMQEPQKSPFAIGTMTFVAFVSSTYSPSATASAGFGALNES
jgi:hypothetical protein